MALWQVFDHASAPSGPAALTAVQGCHSLPSSSNPLLAIKKTKAKRLRFLLVGVRGFEPPASWSRTKHSTKLSHTPINIHFPRRNHPTRRILYRNIADLSISERKKLSTDGKNFFILPSLLKIYSLLWYNITVKNFSERI